MDLFGGPFFVKKKILNLVVAIFFHNIGIDDELGAYMATKYMLEHHHTKIGFLSGEIKECCAKSKVAL